MKVNFRTSSNQLPSENLTQIATILDGTWNLAKAQFAAQNEVRRNHGRSQSLGMQATLNKAIDGKFQEFQWDGENGRYQKDSTWVRLSFRHSMSQGTDFFDALRQMKIEDCNEVVLLYAHQKLLKTISPGDGGSLCSFERAMLLVNDFEVIAPNANLWIGRLDA